MSLLLVVLLACGEKAPDRVALGPVEAATVVDVSVFSGEGDAALPHQDVFIEEGRIRGLGPTGTQPPRGRVVAGAGRTLLPGLIDAHVHITAAPFMPGALHLPDVSDNLQAWLVAGVTMVYDMGGPPRMVAATVRKLASGEQLGPRVRWSTATITVPGGHPIRAIKALLPRPLGSMLAGQVPVIAHPDEADALVAELLRDGPEAVKIIADNLPSDTPKMDAPRLTALVAAAHARGKRAFVHVQREEDALMAAQAGADALVHGILGGRLSEEGAAALGRAGLPIVWTGSGFDATERLARGQWTASAMDRALFPAALLATMEGAAGLGLGSAPVVGQFAAELSPLRADWGENLRRAARAGVPILVGSDSPLPADLPGSSLHAELQWLVEQGLSPAEALRGATSAAARLYDESDRGVIAAGKVADLLLVEGDPLTDIGATAAIVQVWQGGRAVQRLR